ncbi:hypothetical protein WN55_04676 [Dufourea novaeangliae]|uniref:Uncharacterized protein n=1 Tax=Dufourea novaeangliae TaxID=178035 RepID=A0A154P1D2_DUFNO|nr:hypothetical protein WN55_04676 [Dufourea novaeangliae]
MVVFRRKAKIILIISNRGEIIDNFNNILFDREEGVMVLERQNLRILLIINSSDCVVG